MLRYCFRSDMNKGWDRTDYSTWETYDIPVRNWNGINDGINNLLLLASTWLPYSRWHQLETLWRLYQSTRSRCCTSRALDAVDAEDAIKMEVVVAAVGITMAVVAKMTRRGRPRGRRGVKRWGWEVRMERLARGGIWKQRQGQWAAEGWS
jgi:hypothetical protein